MALLPCDAAADTQAVEPSACSFITKVAASTPFPGDVRDTPSPRSIPLPTNMPVTTEVPSGSALTALP